MQLKKQTLNLNENLTVNSDKEPVLNNVAILKPNLILFQQFDSKYAKPIHLFLSYFTLYSYNIVLSQIVYFSCILFLKSFSLCAI